LGFSATNFAFLDEYFLTTTKFSDRLKFMGPGKRGQQQHGGLKTDYACSKFNFAPKFA